MAEALVQMLLQRVKPFRASDVPDNEILESLSGKILHRGYSITGGQ